MNAGTPIPLDSLDIFWRTLSVPWPTVNTTYQNDDDDDDDDDGDGDDDDDDDTSYQNNIRQFTNIYSKATPFVQKNMMTRLKEIFQPESVGTREPAVKKNTRGRPSTKEKKGKATQVPDLNEVPDFNEVPIVDHRRSTATRSTKVPNFNKEPARHSSFTGPSDQQKIRHRLYDGDAVSEMLMGMLPVLWHPYITSIYNVVGDGNCGFRCVAHGVWEQQDCWRQVRRMLLREMDLNYQVYMRLFLEDGFNELRRTIDWFENGIAPPDRYMEMPNTGLVIAELIRRPVAFISLRGWNLCFPLLSGPDFSQRTDPLVIARVGDEVGHFIVLTLDNHSPLPHLHPQWRRNRSEAASEWESLYRHRGTL